MHSKISILLAIFTLFSSSFAYSQNKSSETIPLPAPKIKGSYTLEEVLWKRHSTRNFTSQALSWEQISQMLWAAQGINRTEDKKRTVPSAGSTYPLELYVLIPEGMYHYLPESHAIQKIKTESVHTLLESAGLKTNQTDSCRCVFLITAIFERTSRKFAEAAMSYVYLEAGHAAQDILLQAEALNLGAVPVGYKILSDKKTKLGISPQEEAVYMILTGYPQAAPQPLGPDAELEDH